MLKTCTGICIKQISRNCNNLPAIRQFCAETLQRNGRFAISTVNMDNFPSRTTKRNYTTQHERNPFPSPPELSLRDAVRRSIHSSPPSSAEPRDVGGGGGGDTYRAAVVTELGKPLQIKDLPRTKTLEPGQVRIGLRAAAVNFADILQTQGKYQHQPPLPFVPGTECAGDVLEVASDVTHIKPGDRVVGMAQMGGAYSQEVVGLAQAFMPIPEKVPYSVAAGTIIGYCTAWLALKRNARIQEGETVLVTAAAGSVGLAAVDLAVNVFKTKVIGACGGQDKCEVVKEKGAFATIDYNTENIRDRMKEITGGDGADVIFEVVGGKVFDQSLRSIAFEGRIIIIGFTSGDIPKIPANYLLLKSASAVGIFWGNYSVRNPTVFLESLTEVGRHLEEGTINPHVCKVFPLTQVNDAVKFILDRKSTGKVILDPTS